jgi:hypothetical protein
MKRFFPLFSAFSAIACMCLAAADGKGADASSPAKPFKEDLVLYRNPEQYAAFPGLRQADGDRLWVGFNWNTTRSHYGQAAGGKVGHVELYSPDGGRTWLDHQSKQYSPAPANTSYLVLRDGTQISIAPRMHEVLPGEKKAELQAKGVLVKEWPDGHISASYRVRMSRQFPGQPKPQTSHPQLSPFASMGGFGFGVVLSDDVILKPVYGRRLPTDEFTSAWVLRSDDRGEHWQLIDMASDGQHDFNEADLLTLPDGRLLAIVRVEAGRKGVPLAECGYLWQCESRDSGKTWTSPKRTDMWGYPGTLLLLRNGDILCSYGVRRSPYGIRACLSHDGGQTWDVKNEAVLRDDALGNGTGPGKGSPSDLGYPRSVELSDGTIFTVYYITLGDGVTHIAATRWSPNYRSGNK